MRKGEKDSTKEQIILMKGYDREWRRTRGKKLYWLPNTEWKQEKELFKMKAVLHNKVS